MCRFFNGSSALHLADGNTGVDTFSPDGQYFSYYVGSGTADWIGSLGGGTFLVPGGAMRLIWYNNTGFRVRLGYGGCLDAENGRYRRRFHHHRHPGRRPDDV